MSVEVKDLVKVYGEQTAVDHISFSVKKGEIMGFLGPNGAGKSTTMKIATCFIPPTAGSVQVCGFDVVQNPMEARLKVGYLPEHNPLYTDMYVKEYLAFMGSLYQLKGSLLQQRVDEMVEKTGLTPEYKKKIGSLSKGYRQRVGLAAAMIHNPEVLILDEPTTGLDPNQIVEIRQLIKDAGKEKTVILSTHIMQEVQALCSRAIIINKGKIVADNAVDQLVYVSEPEEKTISRVTVQFAVAVNEAALKAIAGVVSVQPMPGNKYEVVAEETDVRPAIFQLAGAQNWPLLEMKLEEKSLEKVFQKLTK